MHEPIDLSAAGPGDFKRTRSRAVEALWMVVEFLLVTNPLQVSSTLRLWALRLFGARIGANIIMRPRVRVKFPWNLQIGDNCWIGEGVWIHNQGLVTIEDNSVVSQETFITTGSHDVYRSMDLIIKPVILRRGAWLTSRCIVLQGVEVGQNTVVTPGSVVRGSLLPERVYGGNPATFIRERWMTSNETPRGETEA
jgi:putative colanic acid biosynthesis acetyltransferase WcaF